MLRPRPLLARYNAEGGYLTEGYISQIQDTGLNNEVTGVLALQIIAPSLCVTRWQAATDTASTGASIVLQYRIGANSFIINKLNYCVT
jgi:hypothetical protein